MILDIVIYIFNKEKELLNIFNKMEDELKNIKHRYVFVDDSSTDKSLEILRKIQNNNEPIVKIISLSKSYGKDKCIYTGICNTTHNLVCIYDLDLDSSVTYITKMYDYIIKHKEIDQICMESNYNENDLKTKLTIKVYNSLFELKINNNKTYYRILNRNLVNALKNITIPFSNYLIDNLGFKTHYLKFDNNKISNDNLSKYLVYSKKQFIFLKYINIFLIILLFIDLVLTIIGVFKTHYLIIIIMIIYSILNTITYELLNSKKYDNNYSIKEKIGFEDNVL